jgi:hypothetical protein
VGDCLVESISRTVIRAMNDTNPNLLQCEVMEELNRTISRASVGHEQL